MEEFLLILQLILPIIVMIGLGVFCRAKSVLNDNALASLKKLVMDYLMPVLIFSVMLKTTFSPMLLLLAGLSLVMNALGLGTGFLTQKFLGKYGTYHPFLMTGYEVGFLGYALFSLLFGAGGLGFLASMDIGNCVFFFCVYLPMLQSKNGGATVSTKQTLKNIFTAPALIACLAGLACSATGLGSVLLESAAGPILDSVFNMVTSPMTALILIIVGYNLKISKKTIIPVLKTSLLRTLVNGALCLLGVFALKVLGVADNMAIYSLIFMCALSAPYMVTVFAEGEENLAYLSTQVSLYSIVTFIVFILLQVFV